MTKIYCGDQVVLMYSKILVHIWGPVRLIYLYNFPHELGIL